MSRDNLAVAPCRYTNAQREAADGAALTTRKPRPKEMHEQRNPRIH
jgi:hypothetical protein